LFVCLFACLLVFVGFVFHYSFPCVRRSHVQGLGGLRERYPIVDGLQKLKAHKTLFGSEIKMSGKREGDSKAKLGASKFLKQTRDVMVDLDATLLYKRKADKDAYFLFPPYVVVMGCWFIVLFDRC
jgi:hypothetical protein